MEGGLRELAHCWQILHFGILIGFFFTCFLPEILVVFESSGGPKTTKNGFWIKWFQGMVSSADWSQSSGHLGQKIVELGLLVGFNWFFW